MPIIRHYCDIIEILFISQFSERNEMSFNMLKYITNKIFIVKTF